MLLFYTPWKHQKTFRFSDIFRGYRKATPGCNGLNSYHISCVKVTKWDIAIIWSQINLKHFLCMWTFFLWSNHVSFMWNNLYWCFFHSLNSFLNSDFNLCVLKPALHPLANVQNSRINAYLPTENIKTWMPLCTSFLIGIQVKTLTGMRIHLCLVIYNRHLYLVIFL